MLNLLAVFLKPFEILHDLNEIVVITKFNEYYTHSRSVFHHGKSVFHHGKSVLLKENNFLLYYVAVGGSGP